MKDSYLSRREFFKLAALGAGAIGLKPWQRMLPLPEFPAYERLGRVLQMTNLKARPNEDSATVGVLYDDAVVPWLREAAGQEPFNKIWGLYARRWVETPEGYLYAPYVQPVRYLPNQPVTQLQSTSIGEGMWAEVTVPYADVTLDSSPSSNSWVGIRTEQGLPVRLYYGQVFWVDQMRTQESGQVYYRVNPNFYGGLDKLWAPAAAFRPISREELAPLSPEVEEKRVVVNLLNQTLSCFEGNTEVFFCRVSTGVFDEYTPVGAHKISRKFVALQMSGGGSGGTGAGYDLPGIGWVSIFVTGGVAIHATVWHNGFGTRLSHGCVNTRPEDAKWIFRWAAPAVSYDPGMLDATLTGEPSTVVQVVAA